MPPSAPPSHSVLVIGCGSIGERHLRCFQQTKRAAVAACDSNPALLQKVSATYGVPSFSDWELALEHGGYDAVVICTPANWHIAMAARALAGGLHVLIEKPLSHSLAGVAALLEAEQRSGRQVAVAYVMRMLPFLEQARAFIAEGKVGPVREAWMRAGQPFHLLRQGYEQSYYRNRATGGGAIQDALTHGMNWVESVLGPTDTVYCDCAHQVLPGVEVEDTVQVLARNGDVLVSYALNQFQMPNETTFQFNAVAGSVKAEVHRQRWGSFLAGEAEWTWHDAPFPGRDTPFIAEAHAFLDQIEGRPPRLCSLADAAQSLRFNLAALASVESGSRVRCADLHV